MPPGVAFLLLATWVPIAALAVGIYAARRPPRS
jgi:hypothetical protein